MIAVPILHPAFLLRGAEGSRGESRFADTTAHDLARALALQGRKPTWDDSIIFQRDSAGRPFRIFPSADEAVAFLRWAKGRHVVADSETTGEEPLNCKLICLGLAARPAGGEAQPICLPILRQGGAPYFTGHDAWRVFGALRDLACDQRTSWCFHNAPFDLLVARAHGLPIAGLHQDPLLLHHVVDGELPHGLAYVASRYIETCYWKDEAKGKAAWIDLDDATLRFYNLKDVLATAAIEGLLTAEAHRLGVHDLYREEVALSCVMTEATVRGLEVDLARRDSTEIGPDGRPIGLGPRMRQDRDVALGTLRRIAGRDDFNPASVPQLQALLFDRLALPVVAETPKGAPSTDKQAMVLLALHADRPEQLAALKALAGFRRADKIIGTYVEGLRLLADGRLHVTWKVFGTHTGRLSSSPNAQNWNSQIKRLFRAGPGQVFVGVDLSQAELRQIAYLSHDRALLEMYERGLNVHTINTTLLFQVKSPGSDTNEATESYLAWACPKYLGVEYASLPVLPKDRWKRGRHLAKRFVFADNYNAAPDTICDNLRADRDPQTDELLFPDLQLATIEAVKLTWESMHPEIPRWWVAVSEQVHRDGCYRDPLSGRIQWYRGGKKESELVNRPVQGGVASHMNKATLRIADRLWALGGPAAQIVSQIHDALIVETPEALAAECGRIAVEELGRPFSLPGYPAATLPADKPAIGKYLDEV